MQQRCCPCKANPKWKPLSHDSRQGTGNIKGKFSALSEC